MNERRIYDREEIRIAFIYSLDEVDTILEGEWHEAFTEDIGPVLVCGLAFAREEALPIGTEVRIALFMDMALKKSWEKDPTNFPALYYGTVCRIEDMPEEPVEAQPEDDEFVSHPDREIPEGEPAESASEEEAVEVAPAPVKKYKIAVSFKGFELQDEV